MNGKLSILFLLLATSFVSINAHGKLMDPVSRSSAWRLPKYSGFFPEFLWDNEWCATKKETENVRNSTCGVCGPVYHGEPGRSFTEIFKPAANIIVNATSFERNSFAFKNIVSFIPYIVETYQKGQWISPKVKVSILKLSCGKILKIFLTNQSYYLRLTLIMEERFHSEFVQL